MTLQQRLIDAETTQAGAIGVGNHRQPIGEHAGVAAVPTTVAKTVIAHGMFAQQFAGFFWKS